MDLTFFSFITVALLLTAFACTNSNADLSSKTIEEVALLINEEVGTADADSADRCDFIPIGVKPAGGPWGYLVFSSEKSSRERLEELIDRYNELDAERNIEDERMSTADFATEPALTLRNGACYGEGQYAWNPGDILDFNNIERDQS
ncbi:MAG: hypothetical protein EA390_13120 [Balneolaceae bacterium]|nr:MAG: hypothetical protein EA390_13120 [Balneolaceae bacterium]